jgi:hypothetical protein
MIRRSRKRPASEMRARFRWSARPRAALARAGYAFRQDWAKMDDAELLAALEANAGS